MTRKKAVHHSGAIGRDPELVLVAAAAFKGTFGPAAAARAMAAGVHRMWPRAQVVELPLSDGGTGLLEAVAALEAASERRGAAMVRRSAEVSGPLGARVQAEYLSIGGQALIESAEACGLHRIPRDGADPIRATTRGVGELISAAAAGGADEIVMGLGGSATVDGGTGMARALGWSFLDDRGRPLPEGGGPLIDLARIEPPATGGFPLPVVALCDVWNPLLGGSGAARVYGPQKGAGPAEVERLEAALERLAAVASRELGVEVADRPGAGAAGGLGAGARLFLGARLVRGSEWIAGRAGLDAALAAADLVVTGEGRYDRQSSMGKIVGRVLARAGDCGVPVLLVAGRIEDGPPPHVRGLDGDGRTLSPDDVTRLTESGCRAHAAEDTL